MSPEPGRASRFPFDGWWRHTNVQGKIWDHVGWGRVPLLSPWMGNVLERGWMDSRAHGFLSTRPIHPWLLEAAKEASVETSHPHIHTLDHHNEILEERGACDSARFDHVGITWGPGRQHGGPPRQYLIKQVRRRTADFSHQASRPATSAPPGSPALKSRGRLSHHG